VNAGEDDIIRRARTAVGDDELVSDPLASYRVRHGTKSAHGHIHRGGVQPGQTGQCKSNCKKAVEAVVMSGHKIAAEFVRRDFVPALKKCNALHRTDMEYLAISIWSVNR
jgi:hypothetical protein